VPAVAFSRTASSFGSARQVLQSAHRRKLDHDRYVPGELDRANYIVRSRLSNYKTAPTGERGSARRRSCQGTAYRDFRYPISKSAEGLSKNSNYDPRERGTRGALTTSIEPSRSIEGNRHPRAGDKPYLLEDRGSESGELRVAPGGPHQIDVSRLFKPIGFVSRKHKRINKIGIFSTARLMLYPPSDDDAATSYVNETGGKGNEKAFNYYGSLGSYFRSRDRVFRGRRS
jgi:hypothetical protein